MKKRIFIIDDEPDMVKIATDLLEPDGFQVSSDVHPVSGLKKVRANPPDLLLLDVRLPEIDGYQVLKELKNDAKTKHIPVIMVSVKSEEADVVVGLQMGAEDYISKPFRRQELLARVKTVLRRIDPEDQTQVIQVGPFKVDFGAYNAWINKTQLTLTPKEFELLANFVRKEGRVLTRSALSESVWGIEFIGSTRTIDVHVDTLRKKLGRFGGMIKSLKGVGYRLEVDE